MLETLFQIDFLICFYCRKSIKAYPFTSLKFDMCLIFFTNQFSSLFLAPNQTLRSLCPIRTIISLSNPYLVLLCNKEDHHYLFTDRTWKPYIWTPLVTMNLTIPSNHVLVEFWVVNALTRWFLCRHDRSQVTKFQDSEKLLGNSLRVLD